MTSVDVLFQAGDEQGLIALLTDRPSLAENVDREGVPLLIRSIAARHRSLVHAIVQHFPLPLEQQDLRGNRPIHAAARAADVQTVLWLLEKNVDLAAQNALGETVLHLLIPHFPSSFLPILTPTTSSSSSSSTSHPLISNSTTPLTASSSTTPSISSTSSPLNATPSISSTSSPLNATPSISSTSSPLNSTPLASTPSSSSSSPLNTTPSSSAHHDTPPVPPVDLPSLLALLISRCPALLNARTLAGATPLHVATELNLPSAVDFLLSHKALPNVRNAVADTPLHVAAYHKRYQIAASLLIAGANASSTGSRGSVANFAQHTADLILQDIIADPQLFARSFNAPPSPLGGKQPMREKQRKDRLKDDWTLLQGDNEAEENETVESRRKKNGDNNDDDDALIESFVEIPEDHRFLVYANPRRYYRWLGALAATKKRAQALGKLWKVEREAEIPRGREASTLSLKTLIRASVPDHLRRAVWLAITGTNDLYLASAGQEHWQRALLFAFGPAQCLPGHGFDIQGRLFGADGFFGFGDHCLNAEGETWAKRILLVLVRMNGDVDHCTPLPDALCLLLLFMGEQEAFLTAMAMLQDSRSRRWYFNLGPKNTQLFYLTFDDLVRKKYSNLADHISNLGLSSSDYAIAWFERLFVSALPHPSVLYIFDAYLNEGSKILYRAGLAILDELRPQLLHTKSKRDFINILSVFTQQLHLPRIAQIMYDAYSIYLSRSTFAALERANEWKATSLAPALTQQFYTPRPQPRPSSIISFEAWEKLYSHFPSRIRIMDPHLVFSNEDGYSLTNLVSACNRLRRNFPCLLLIKSISPSTAVFGCYTSSKWLYKGDVSYGCSPESFLFSNHAPEDIKRADPNAFHFYHVNPDFTPEFIQEHGVCFQVINASGLFLGIDNNGVSGLFIDYEIRFGRTGACQLFANPSLVTGLSANPTSNTTTTTTAVPASTSTHHGTSHPPSSSIPISRPKKSSPLAGSPVLSSSESSLPLGSHLDHEVLSRRSMDGNHLEQEEEEEDANKAKVEGPSASVALSHGTMSSSVTFEIGLIEIWALR